MFIIGETVVERNIATERFACDLSQCEGACCTLPGGRGAPLDDDEVEELHRAYLSARKYLSPKHAWVIDRAGIVEGSLGSFATTCVDKRECVFVFYENGIAKCALEQAYVNGETSWRKPLSCHLFPIRISRGSHERLRYEKIPECSPARLKGLRMNVLLSDFARDALIRKYGAAWYEEFRQACERSAASAAK